MRAMNNQKGFTLLEILVVFSIMAVLSGLGFTSFVSYSRSQQLTQAASNIKLLLNQARFNAISVVKTNKDIGGTTFSCGDNALLGYSVFVSGREAGLYQECAGVASRAIRQIILPPGHSFAQGTTCTQIHFDSLSATATGVPCIIIVRGFSQGSNPQLKTISIDVAGNASIQ